MRVATTAALALAVLASLSAPPAVRAQRASAQRDAAVPFRVGETLAYDVSWSSVLVAATATAQVVDRKPSAGSTAYTIVVEGRPVPLLARLYNLYYKMDSQLDSVTLLSHRGALYSEEGADKTLGTTRFDRSMRRAFYERRADRTDTIDFAVPPGTQDGLAVLYTIRGHAFKAGERFSVPVADSGALFTVQIDVAAPEAVIVPAGQFRSWSLKAAINDAQGQPVWENVAVWVSDDGRRLPVKLQAELPIGRFVLALREAR